MKSNSTTTNISLSLVIPLYNESRRFREQLPQLLSTYRQHPQWEFIFVDDGSTDDTPQIVSKAIRNKSRMSLIHYPLNQGKGYALKQGIVKAKNRAILFSDIDFSTPLSQLDLMYPFLEEGAQVVIGTRKVTGATITRHQAYLREWLGRRFTNLSNLWLGLSISDYTCGFKLFEKTAAHRLFKLQQIKRWGFDAEVLFLAVKLGYKVVEVPVVWHNDDRTKVNLTKDLINSITDLWQIKWNYWQHNYRNL